MNSKFAELAEKAGFVMWEDEEYKTGLIDWASDYDTELEHFGNLVLDEAISLINNIAETIPVDESIEEETDCIEDISYNEGYRDGLRWIARQIALLKSNPSGR